MEKRIEEFIKEYLPKNITKEKRYELRKELESHIYDRIDYYAEIGFSEEESLEKAIDDFGKEENIKNQIKNDLGNIHVPWSLARFFSKSIPITVAVIFLGGIALSFLFRVNDIKYLVVIPLCIWIVIIALDKFKKIHHIVKSVIAFILVVPYFLMMLTGYFFWNTNFYTISHEDKVLSLYYDLTTSEESNNKIDEYMLKPDKIGDPIDSIYFSIEENSAFSDPWYCTYIFEYTQTEYRKIKEELDNTMSYRDKFISDDGKWVDDEYTPGYIEYNCNFSVYGFDFKTIYTPNEEDIYYDGLSDCEEYDFWFIIGTNDNTNEIAFIYLTPAHFTPGFDEEFIKEECGWRYFYHLTKF